MSDSPSLGLPYLAAAQAQKHVTLNEALSLLDGLIHLAIESRGLASPPGSPSDGQRWLIAAAPTGEWAGHAGEIALRMEGAWRFLAPREGWRLWVADEDTFVGYTGTAWISLGVPNALQNMSMVGINATADASNRLTVSSTATLLNNAGNGHQLKINKAAAADTASLLFQTGFSGRAEMGTTGDDGFHLKVSADGSAFTEVMVADQSSGSLSIRKPLTLEGQSADPATPANGQLWYNAASGKFRARENGISRDIIAPVATSLGLLVARHLLLN